MIARHVYDIEEITVAVIEKAGPIQQKRLKPGGHFTLLRDKAGPDHVQVDNFVRPIVPDASEQAFVLNDISWQELSKAIFEPDGEYVWVFLISGSAPPANHIGGWRGSDGHRQPPMYFPCGGSTLRGIAKPGEIVWSRIRIDGDKPGGRLCMDLGRAGVVKLPQIETERRWNETTYQWPIMHAVTYGTTREQMMARHKANHIQCAYAKDANSADLAMLTKAAMAQAMGMNVSLCGTKKERKPWG